MADYISILDKAVTGLAENTPNNRAIIFDKARAAIERKLRAMDPVPSEDAISRQLGQLESAIVMVDAKYAAAPAETQPESIAAEPPIAATAEPTAPSMNEPAPQNVAVSSPQVSVPAGFIDDIILIDGIGEKTASLLADENVVGISQIAAMSDSELAALTEKIGFAGFEVTQEWKLQADEMLGGALPRSKTDQTRLAKLKEAAPEIAPETAAETAMETAPEPAVQQTSEPEPTPEPISPAPSPEALSEQTPPDIAMPNVTAPVINKPVLDHGAEAGEVHAPSTLSPAPAAPVVSDPPSIDAPAPASPSQSPDAVNVREALEAKLDAISNEQANAAQAANTLGESQVSAPAAPSAPLAPSSPQAPEPPFVAELDNDPAASPANDPYLDRPVEIAPPKKGGAGKAVATGSILLLLGAAAAGAYVYKDTLLDLGNKGVEAVKELINVKEAPTTSTGASSGTDSETEPEAEPTNEAESSDPAVKDTTRLGSDGTETQEPTAAETDPVSEPVSEPVTPIAETVPETVEAETPATVEVQEETPSETAQETTTEDNSAASTETPAVEETAPAPVAINGEKSFLYEEALGTTGANRDEGSIVWSLVSEPPETGAAPEAVIKGVMEIPSRGLAMNLSIKRNIDAGLPASHIIELFFTAPSEFTGGNIDGVSRFVMKSTEQARGESLVGVPARIDTGFFLIALNNLEQAQKTNLSLLENSDWVDIPVSYVTGRRALLTFEKGASGKEVFSQALADWKNR